MPRLPARVMLTLPLLAAGCLEPRVAVTPPGATAPLFDDIGAHTRDITAQSDLAKRYFHHGLTWVYAFNHDQARASFQEAARLEPDCAMAHWGVTLCNGPHINYPIVPPDRAAEAWRAIAAARAKLDRASPVERALIEAAAARFSADPRAERRPLDEAYAAAMQKVWQQFPHDNDVGVLYAEALMDLQPWDLWTPQGRPKGRTTEIVAVLEQVLARNPRHPGAAHLYIHAVESSPHPEKANAAADVLRTAVPASGHLVHMPSHIDARTGRWALAVDQNDAAVESDRRYRLVVKKSGFQNLYKAHNLHFMSFCATMEGRYEKALTAARQMIARVPPDFARENPALVDPYMSIALDVMKRFGRWDDILREPLAPEALRITRTMQFFMRGLAAAAKGDLAAAKRERAAFAAARARVPADAVLSINRASSIFAIAEKMLDAEIAYREERADAAIALLRDAVKLEEALLYMEPPEWIQPVRHTLGAFLMDAGKHEAAEKVYREDLGLWPENGWALYGLAEALRGQGRKTEAAEVMARHRKAWARADTKIRSTCLCVAQAEE